MVEAAVDRPGTSPPGLHSPRFAMPTSATAPLDALRIAASTNFLGHSLIAGNIAQARLGLNSKGGVADAGRPRDVLTSAPSKEASFRSAARRRSRESPNPEGTSNEPSPPQSEPRSRSSRERLSREDIGSPGSGDGLPDMGRRPSVRGERRRPSLRRPSLQKRTSISSPLMLDLNSLMKVPETVIEATSGDDPALIEAYFDAVTEGDVDMVMEALDKGVDANSTDDEGNTALLFAAEGEPQIVEVLLKAGVDVNKQNEGGLTALMRAVQYEDEEIIRQLLAHGADMSIADLEGKKAADHAENVDVRIILGVQERDNTPGSFRNSEKKKGGHRNSMGRDPAGRRASTVNVSRTVAQLFDAVSSGDVDETKALLATGLPVDARDDDSNTPLIIAAEGEPGIVEVLLENGAEIDLQNKNGVTALIAAVKYEDATLVKQLVQGGASLTLRDRKGRCAADFAKEVDMSVQQEILELLDVTEGHKSQRQGKQRRRRKSMVYVDQQTRELLEAVSAGDLAKVKDFIKQEYPVNAHDDDGNTALIFAAEREPLIVELMLSEGALVDHQNKKGVTALMTAVKAEDMDSIKALMDKGSSTTLKNKDGHTAVDLAAQTGSEDIVRLVLGMGAAAGAAPGKSAPRLPQEVMRRGSLPSCSSIDRRTRAFLEAVTEGDAERVERILIMEFDVNCCDDVGLTPLHFAAEGEPAILKILLKHGANVNATNNLGETPIMKAVVFDDAECSKLILDAGARVDIADKFGKTVHDYAATCKSTIIQSMLRPSSRG